MCQSCLFRLGHFAAQCLRTAIWMYCPGLLSRQIWAYYYKNFEQKSQEFTGNGEIAYGPSAKFWSKCYQKIVSINAKTHSRLSPSTRWSRKVLKLISTIWCSLPLVTVKKILCVYFLRFYNEYNNVTLTSQKKLEMNEKFAIVGGFVSSIIAICLLDCSTDMLCRNSAKIRF